jgi:hypothetical protein
MGIRKKSRENDLQLHTNLITKFEGHMMVFGLCNGN